MSTDAVDVPERLAEFVRLHQGAVDPRGKVLAPAARAPQRLPEVEPEPVLEAEPPPARWADRHVRIPRAPRIPIHTDVDAPVLPLPERLANIVVFPPRHGQAAPPRGVVYVPAAATAAAAATEVEVQVEAEAEAPARPRVRPRRARRPAAVPRPTVRLGETLVAAGLLDERDIEDALAIQRFEGGRIGEILCHNGRLTEEDLARVLAERCDLGYVDALALDVDAEVALRLPANLALRHLALPWRDADGIVDVAVVDPLDDRMRATLEEHLGPVRLQVAGDSALDIALQAVHGSDSVRIASSRLAEQRKVDSASTTFTRGQITVAAIAAVILAVGLVLSPVATIVAFNVVTGFFYLGSSIYKLILARDSLRTDMVTPVSDAEVAALDDRDLPVFTILMPMYREAAVVRKLVGSIAQLDYPRHKLDVKLLLEADDDETLDAIRDLRLPPHFRIVIVPDAQPKTKPKACNYGLLFARGDITVIYDAEDEPDPDQLKRVVVAFGKGDPAMVCVQCKLNYYNRTQNLLTRWFTTEYSQWFDIFLPGLDNHDVPIPLGGTSNHFITSELVRLGAWDPHNVAEDADLGIRLNKAGWRTGVVDSTTYEEANPDLPNWIRQRSRWVKGYMQTWLVHMRHPVRLLRALGPRSFLSFQMTVGGTFFGFLLNPIYWLLTSMWLLTQAGVIQQLFPGIVYYMAAIGLFVGNITFTYLNAVGAMRRGYHDLAIYALFSPLYWALMSFAAWKGAIQLITKPHYWEKTEHGLATMHETSGR